MIDAYKDLVFADDDHLVIAFKDNKPVQIAFPKMMIPKEYHNLFIGSAIAYDSLTRMHAHMGTIVSAIERCLTNDMSLAEAKVGLQVLAETVEQLQTGMLDTIRVLEVGPRQVIKEVEADAKSKIKR